MNITVQALLAGCFITLSCSRSGILSKDKVANIMYEMFVADEYAKTYPEVNLAADSLLLFQHIFDKYGCTLEDYQKSIRHYLSDDKAYNYILKTATQIAKDSAKAAEKDLNSERRGLYYTIPYKAPEMINAVNDWWNRDFRGERLRYGQFYNQLKKVLIKEKKRTIEQTIPKKGEKDEQIIAWEGK